MSENMAFEEKLRSFLKHYEALEATVGQEGEEGYYKEFMELEGKSQKYRENDSFPTDSGKLPCNKKKNRFKDILPFEHTMVALYPEEGVEGSDYINANYITNGAGEVDYIAAQGPLPHTVNDFWRMLWYHNIEIVCMTCREVEMGKNKCERYWTEPGESKMFGPIKVTTLNEVNMSNYFIIRDLQAECQGEQQLIRQYHYTAWPDHLKPTSIYPILRMIEMIHEFRQKKEVPIVAHCSAGCGRTGTIITMDIIKSIVQSQDASKDVDVYKIVEHMRTQRPAMVQAKDQYHFVYQAAASLARDFLEGKKLLARPPLPKSKPSPKLEGKEPTHDYENWAHTNAIINSLMEKNEDPPKPMPRKKSVKTNHSFDSSLNITLDDDAKVDEDQPKLNRQLSSQNKDIIQQINGLSLELQNLKLKQESSARKQSDLQKENASLTSGIQNYVQRLTETEEHTRKLEDDIHQLTLSLNQSREENKRLNDEHKKMKEEYQTLKQDHDQFASSLEAIQKENQILRESKVEVERYLTERISLLEKQVETMQPSWNINPTKLRVTDEELGRGAYGEVKVGMYCGSRVAVKRVHQVIISDYNRDQFKREMQIVSRLRHPHLVLFIGAVTTGTLKIVTELMETSLRKQLELGRISEKHILPISRDVACALNYLHSLPEPIIHRDVSSANVLLNSKPGGGWMAKLGDFGSANFLAQLSTVAPGCVAYAAPECQTPALQGPKMDVYSFGILLFEMFTGKLPDPGRVHLLRVAPPSGSTAKQAMTEIAKICVCQKVDNRPNMAAVYARLGQI